MDGMGDAVLNNGSCDSLPFEPENRLEELQDTISENSKVKINSILKEVDTLTPIEKLLLYFKLPTEKSLVDPLKQPTNPLGSRVEINLTIQWIKTHLEEDPDISLQKKNVYDEYTSYCNENQIKPLSTADFGKVMKQVYPRVKPRRLGTRGNSQYCYSGLRTRIKLGTPGLPDLSQKPQSTEFTIWNDSDVFAAVWCIVKEWSETKLGSKFNSWFNLAHFLVKNHSIGVGTNAASVIISAIQNEQNGDLTNAVNSNRHKETIRKIQQKCEGKELKRKLQVQQIKQEPKSRSKKPKVVLPSSTSTSRGSSPSSSSSSAENKLQSPQLQGPKQVCDIDFRNGAAATQQQEATPPLLAAVSFHKPPPAAVEGKVAIPRLPTASKQQQLQSPPDSTAPRSKNMKYKHIQPKCDMSTYNLQQTTNVNAARGTAANHRSQETLGGKLSSRKLRKREETVTASLLEDDTTEFLLSRQRLISVGNLDKDALDEYLGKNNSQETEEEIMHYYENSRFEDTNKNIQLSQLRSLLEQSTTVQDNNANLKSSLKQDAPVVLPNFQSSLGRRRVSFDPQYPEEVPPSPNTRTKNYSFTPISPGSKSPKSSSATPSPFVSPRNTPLPRTRGNSHPYLLAYPLSKKIRKNVKDFDVTQININMPMSAPPSPKVAFSHNTQTSFTYNVPTNVQNDQLSAEVSSLFDSLPPSTDPILMRSQSVPVNVAQTFNTIPFYNDYNFPEQLQTAANQLTSDQLSNELSTSEHTFGPVDNILTNSIDLNSLKINPSRSVPSTPIPVQQAETKLITNPEVNSYSSRSYPSTPMTNETFQYGGKTKDYLLNGQPIKDKKPDEDIAELSLMDMEGLEIGHGLQGLDAIDNKEDGFDFVQLDGTVTGFTVKQNEEDFDGIDGDYFKGVTDG